MPTPLPPKPHLDHLKKQAKCLLKSHRNGDLQACEALRQHLPHFAQKSDDEILAAEVTLHDVQHAIALHYGFANWSALRAAVAECNGTQAPASGAKPRLSALKDLDEKLRRHIEMLGFATVGAYRIWCHKEGFGSGLDKSDAQLYEELVRRQQEPPRPVLRRDYRPADERNITRAYQGEDDDLWDGWKVPFEGIEDADEREALYRLLLHCTRYAPIGGPLLWQLARYHRDWLHLVEEWIPKSQNEKGLLAELTRFLLGRDEPPRPDDARLQRGEAPSACYARIRAQRETVLSPEEVEAFENRGYLRLKGAFPRAAALEMQDFMWSELERMHGFRGDDPATWNLEGWSPDKAPYRWTMLRLNQSKTHPVYKKLAAPRMVSALEEVAGEHAASLKQSWGAFTPVFPSRSDAPWDLGCGGEWGCYADPQVPWSMGVTTFFSDVLPRSGGRLLVEGSHRLVRAFFDRLKPSQLLDGRHLLREFYQQYPFFAELTGKTPDQGDRVRRFMEETTEVEGVELRVVELTGEPGDAVFYNRSLVSSSAARNVTDTPVFMRG